ncbi:MAG: nucleotidyltransferase family protein [Acidobacteria bacterium]|nr:nucleotidyltransferase family protein [Acidobacteriota bacterium]
MLVAIILAAGDSRRMGTPKALLPDPDGRPFVARLARTFSSAGVDRIVIVTGALHDAIASAIAAEAPAVATECARNPDPSRGQLSSLWIGLDAAGSHVEGVLMIPVDIPLVRESTIREVVESWRRTHAPIVRPAVGERHGHPVLFDRSTFDALRHAPLSEGARVVVHAHANRVVNVPVDDDGCLVDVDTPAEYEAMIGKKT